GSGDRPGMVAGERERQPGPGPGAFRAARLPRARRVHPARLAEQPPVTNPSNARPVPCRASSMSRERQGTGLCTVRRTAAMTSTPAPLADTMQQAEGALGDAELDYLRHPDDPRAWAELKSAREWVAHVHAAMVSHTRYSEAMSELYALHLERAGLAINAALDLDAAAALRADEDATEQDAWDALADAATTPY